MSSPSFMPRSWDRWQNSSRSRRFMSIRSPKAAHIGSVEELLELKAMMVCPRSSR